MIKKLHQMKILMNELRKEGRRGVKVSNSKKRYQKKVIKMVDCYRRT
jgi:hypothetical protein